MTLGTGIFLSTLLLALVGLYINTRGRWNWIKISLWALGSAVLLIAGGVGIYFAVEYQENRPRPQTGFGRIEIGEVQSDVLFKEGKPKYSWPDEDSVTETWAYFRDDSYTYVQFKTKKVSAIQYTTTKAWSYVEVNGISLGNHVEVVVDHLGEPDVVSESADQLSRIYNYKKYHCAYEMQAGKVQSLIIIHPKNFPWKYLAEYNPISPAEKTAKTGPWDKDPIVNESAASK